MLVSNNEKGMTSVCHSHSKGRSATIPNEGDVAFVLVQEKM